VTLSPARWLTAAVFLAGCAAPQQPLQLGFHEVPSNVILGAQPTPAGLPTAPVAFGPPVPPPPLSVVAFPPPAFTSPTHPDPLLTVRVPVAPTCAPADPLRTPALEAPAQISAPPTRAAYLFRNDGTFTVSGADARTGRFPSISLRTVGKATGVPSDFSFDVADSLGDVTTTTTYEVVTSSLVPAARAPGIYLAAVKSARGTQSSTFAPSPALLLAGFPFVRGASVTSSGVDPVSATAMRFTATVTGKARVDACGTPLDSWTVALADGTLVSPNENLTFRSTYAFGTQYGGLVLADTTSFQGMEGSDGVSRNNTATITTAPKL
jgi:hypothetical protein